MLRKTVEFSCLLMCAYIYILHTCRQRGIRMTLDPRHTECCNVCRPGGSWTLLGEGMPGYPASDVTALERGRGGDVRKLQ